MLRAYSLSWVRIWTSLLLFRTDGSVSSGLVFKRMFTHSNDAEVSTVEDSARKGCHETHLFYWVFRLAPLRGSHPFSIQFSSRPISPEII